MKVLLLVLLPIHRKCKSIIFSKLNLVNIFPAQSITPPSPSCDFTRIRKTILPIQCTATTVTWNIFILANYFSTEWHNFLFNNFHSKCHAFSLFWTHLLSVRWVGSPFKKSTSAALPPRHSQKLFQTIQTIFKKCSKKFEFDQIILTCAPRRSLRSKTGCWKKIKKFTDFDEARETYLWSKISTICRKFFIIWIHKNCRRHNLNVKKCADLTMHN